MIYDGFERPSQSTSVYGAVTTYSYASSGFPLSVTATTNNHSTGVALDGFGRTIWTVRSYSDSGGSHTASIVNMYYAACACSPLGKMYAMTEPYVPGGTIYTTNYTFDGLGRTATVVAADGASTTRYAYSGNTTTITDPAGNSAGKWKKYTYDVFGNLIQVNEPNPAGGADYVTTYTYDMLNHLTQVSMPRPNGTQTRTYAYDPTTQRLSSETHPETGTKSYTYNGDGTVATSTDAKTQVAQYTYDAHQRITEVQFFPDPTHPTSEATCQRVTITWDVGTNAMGRIGNRQTGLSTCLNNPTETFSYTSAGQITDKHLSMPTFHLTATLDGLYGYDNEGHLTSTTYPVTYYVNTSGGISANPAIKYTYTLDADERPVSMKDNQSTPITWVTGATYHAAGPITQWTGYVYDGIHNFTESRQYNALTQLTRITNSLQDTEYVTPVRRTTEGSCKR
jgi:YD repeat-containing protein